MPLETVRKRRRRLSMTSLIDVIFLLLLFFMLTSTFSKFGEVELQAHGHGGRAIGETAPKAILSLSDSTLRFNGVPETLETLRATISSQLAQTPTGTLLVLVSMTDDVTSQTLVDTLSLMRDLKGLHPVILD